MAFASIFSKYYKGLHTISKAIHEEGRKESIGRRLALGLTAAAFCTWNTPRARAQDKLDAAGATFKDYATLDNGASFYRVDGMGSSGVATDLSVAKLLGVDNAKGEARIRFESVKTEVTLPLGWQAGEDWERGVGFSADKSFRLIVWRVEFAFEGVRDAEHYVATKAGSITARRPRVKAQARKLGGDSFLVIYENVPPAAGDSEPRVVFDMLRVKERDAKAGMLLTLGVPTSQAERGLRLAALINGAAKPDW